MLPTQTMPLSAAAPFALFDDATWPHRSGVFFSNPIGEIRADRISEVYSALDALDAVRQNGKYVAGYFAYELGYCFEPRLQRLLPTDSGPLLHFLVFDHAETLHGNLKLRRLLENAVGSTTSEASDIDNVLANYDGKFFKIRKLIGDGDVYQVNLTVKHRGAFLSDPVSSYLTLRERARGGSSAILRMQDQYLLSLSPELFFHVSGQSIQVRPMKGTCARRPNPRDDDAEKKKLQSDEKQRAENLMIVDLMRNDISRVCVPGSVAVSDLFTVETYPTFHTLTSGVRGRLRNQARFREIIPALFPCGSVTGAPKIRAMEIIREVEDEPRGVYCGSIGFAGPDTMSFNVAIRTLAVKNAQFELGVGGGIVWDSDVKQEADECKIKARFFTEPHQPMRLLETLKWSADEGFAYLRWHLLRLQTSSRYFGYSFDEEAVRARLNESVANMTAPQVVRLTLGIRGDTQIEVRDLQTDSAAPQWSFALSSTAVQSSDWRLYHKTTRREVYDAVLEAFDPQRRPDEVVLINERGELTEGTRANLFLERDGVLFTPPTSCGLLEGCLRRDLMEGLQRRVVERVLFPGDLDEGTVWFGNSVRGLIRGVRFDANAPDRLSDTLPPE